LDIDISLKKRRQKSFENQLTSELRCHQKPQSFHKHLKDSPSKQEEQQ
jgi:hypothetical protein